MLSLREMDVTTEIDSTMFDSGDDEDDDSASEIDDATDSSDVDEEVDVDEKEGADASVMRKFSQINVSDEIEKGKAVKAQLSKVLSVCFNYKRVTAPRFILYVIVLFFFPSQYSGMWDSLLECRIKMQKLLLLANQLPQHNTWSQFSEKSDESFHSTLEECKL